ncbi:MAG: hypothetical protein ACPG32_07865, partial [Akkermansiaceae bacterium]
NTPINSYALQFEKTGEITSDSGNVDKVIRAAEEMEANGNADKAAEGKAIRLWMEIMKREEAILTKGANELLKCVEYASIKKKEDVDGLSEIVHKYQKINAASKEGINGKWIQEVKDQLKTDGVTTARINTLISSLESGFSKVKPTLLTIRQTDTALCEAVLEQHAILKKNFGHWHWDEAQGVPVFAEDVDDAVIDEYNAAANKLQKAANEQAAAQAKLIQQQ